MDRPNLRSVDGAHSVAYDASCEFDNIKLELEAISSTAWLLATAELLDERAQDAFRGLANSLDAIIARVNTASDQFMARRESRDAVAPAHNNE